MVARFFIFVISFAMVFGFISKWIYLLLKKGYDKEQEAYKNSYNKLNPKKKIVDKK